MDMKMFDVKDVFNIKNPKLNYLTRVILKIVFSILHLKVYKFIFYHLQSPSLRRSFTQPISNNGGDIRLHGSRLTPSGNVTMTLYICTQISVKIPQIRDGE